MVGERPKVVVIGAGGHARVVVELLAQAGWDVVGCLDERLEGTPAREVTELTVAVGGAPVLRGDALAALDADVRHAVVAIGDNARRLERQGELGARGLTAATAVHPRATVAGDVRLGPGTVVMAGAVVNPGTTIGAGVIVNTGATVDHDCVIEDGAHLSPGAHLAGGVRVGARAHVGIGAAVIERVTIGADARVGAGAAVVRDVPAGALVVGVPARPVEGLRGRRAEGPSR